MVEPFRSRSTAGTRVTDYHAALRRSRPLTRAARAVKDGVGRTDTATRLGRVRNERVQPFAIEHSPFTARLFKARPVRLENQTAPMSRNRLGRLLAFVYRPSDSLLVDNGRDVRYETEG